MRIRLVILSIALLALGACSTTAPFTQQIRNKYQLTAEELQSIQFYTSDDIILRRGESGTGKTTEDGTLKLKSGQKIEEVKIPAGTPCVVEKVIDNQRMALRFGDAKDEYLVFGSIKQRDGYYVLQALDWRKGRGKVMYGDQYYHSNLGSEDVFLTIKLQVLKEFKKESKTVPGQKVK